MIIINQKFACWILYSDSYVYEIVSQQTDKKITVREMDYEETPEWKAAKNFVPGGFYGTVVNQFAQQWIFTSNPKNRVQTLRLHKDGYWRNKHRNKFILTDKPQMTYDYNF